MDEELENFARQYALRRNITLGDRLAKPETGSYLNI